MDIEEPSKCKEKPPRSSKRLSFSRSSLRKSKQRLDEFFKSPSLGKIRGSSKRKRHRTDDDNVSLSSVDLNAANEDEPTKRKRSSLTKVASLVGLLSPIRPMKNALQNSGLGNEKSISMRSLAGDKFNGTPYRQPAAGATWGSASKRRPSTYWHETVEDGDIQHMNQLQIKRQEAIFELYKCEEDLIEDLKMVKTMYHDSLKKLGLMTDDELQQIFGHIDALIPLHQDLVEAMKDQRLPDGTTEFVGQVIYDWVPCLEKYVSYCSNQVKAKALLDTKKQDPSIEDFLQRCRDCAFSRKLDLWSFLDVPRSGVVKYPLLLRSIIKYTPEGHEDLEPLAQAISVIEDVIAAVDISTGKAKCSHTKARLHYLDEKLQKSPLLDSSEVILCDGVLKNSRGTKLHVYLFDQILVLTRQLSQGHYQVYRQPIPVSELVVEDFADGQTEKRSGSFKSVFTQSTNSKYMFRVSFMNPKRGQAHTLQTADASDKRHWMTCLRAVLPHDIPVTRMTRSVSAATLIRRSESCKENSTSSRGDGMAETVSLAGSCTHINQESPVGLMKLEAPGLTKLGEEPEEDDGLELEGPGLERNGPGRNATVRGREPCKRRLDLSASGEDSEEVEEGGG